MKHLVIPDAHVKPNQNLVRMNLLGNLIVREKPDKIICLGDFADMESLCSYDTGKRTFEGRRYNNDLSSVISAQKEMFFPLKEYNERRRRQKKSVYTPELYMCIGNHEDRITRATQLDPHLEGTMSIKDLKYEKFGWNVIDFLQVLELDGVHYSHYFVSGVMGRPIGGEHPASSLLSKQFVSCTSGHSHVLDYSRKNRADGKAIQGLVAGCFLDHREDYAGPANDLWWSGVVIKYNVNNGDYDPEFIALKRMRERYA